MLALVMTTKCSAGDGVLGTHRHTHAGTWTHSYTQTRSCNCTKHRDTSAVTVPSPRHAQSYTQTETPAEPLRTDALATLDPHRCSSGGLAGARGVPRSLTSFLCSLGLRTAGLWRSRENILRRSRQQLLRSAGARPLALQSESRGQSGRTIRLGRQLSAVRGATTQA